MFKNKLELSWQKMALNFYFQYLLCFSSVILLINSINAINIIAKYVGLTLFALSVSWKLIDTYNRYIRKCFLTSNGKAVLITGCDSGFGNQLALKLNSLGFTVIATCLENSDSELSRQLVINSQFPRKLVTIKLDVTSDEDVQQCYRSVEQMLRNSGDELWAVVNNAGVLGIGYVEWCDTLSAYQKTIDVNVLGTVRVTRSFLPLIRRSKGRIINVTSIAARISPAGFAPYCMSKHAVQAFNDSLRREMQPFGVKVISIEPSCYRTPIITVSAVKTSMDECWNSTAKQIRYDYGEQLFNRYKQSYENQVSRARDPIEVIDAMVNAIINAEPLTRYKCCGTSADIAWCLAEHIPDKLFDSVFVLAERVLLK